MTFGEPSCINARMQFGNIDELANKEEIYAVKKHLTWKVLFLLFCIIGLTSSIFWYSDILLNYYCQLFNIKG